MPFPHLHATLGAPNLDPFTAIQLYATELSATIIILARLVRVTRRELLKVGWRRPVKKTARKIPEVGQP